MTSEIKNRRTGEVILRVEADSLKGADLRGAKLRYVNLEYVNLRGSRKKQ